MNAVRTAENRPACYDIGDVSIDYAGAEADTYEDTRVLTNTRRVSISSFQSWIIASSYSRNAFAQAAHASELSQMDGVPRSRSEPLPGRFRKRYMG